MAWVLAVLAFASLLILAMYNPEWVGIKFLVWQTSLPLVVIVLGAAVLGGLLVGAYALVRGIGQRQRRKGDAERIRQLEQELTRAQEQGRYLDGELQRLRAAAGREGHDGASAQGQSDGSREGQA